MNEQIKRDFRIAANALAGVSAVATVWCYLSGYSGFEAWLFAALGAICCLMQPRIWAVVLTQYRDLGVPVLTVAIAAGVLCSWTDLTSNFQTISAARGLDVQNGELKTEKFKQAHKGLTESENLLSDAKGRLQAMNSQNAWLATATVAGLDAKIENQQGDYIFKRSRSCADVTLSSSRRFCDRLTTLRDRRAVALERDRLLAHIGKQKGQVNAARADAVQAKPGESRAYLQAYSMASLLSWDGSEVSDVARENLHNLINVALAFALWLLPTALMVCGFRASAPVQSPLTTHQSVVVNSRAAPTSSGPPGGGGGGQGVDPIEVEIPVNVKAGINYEQTVNRQAEAIVHELRPRASVPIVQPRGQDIPMPSRRIVRVRDTKFARRVAQLTHDYKSARG